MFLTWCFELPTEFTLKPEQLLSCQCLFILFIHKSSKSVSSVCSCYVVLISWISANTQIKQNPTHSITVQLIMYMLSALHEAVFLAAGVLFFLLRTCIMTSPWRLWLDCS